MQYIDEYFATARERYEIMLKKSRLEPRPWTSDTIFQNFRFCNVHREHDKTTQWLRDHIRQPLIREFQRVTEPELNAVKLEIVLATLAFRWFNKIETGVTLLDLLLGKWDSEEAMRRLRGVSPVVSGAYIILGKQGMEKAEGVLWCIDTARRLVPTMQPWNWKSLQDAHADLKELPYMGRFMAYEVVTDLRHTPVLSDAPDITTWASAGPGCARGLGWANSGNSAEFSYGSQWDQNVMNNMMYEIVEASKKTEYWPKEWQAWEMREAEHWACEYDKYKRAQAGDKLKRRYQ